MNNLTHTRGNENPLENFFQLFLDENKDLANEQDKKV
jgi:hypothetical protein